MLAGLASQGMLWHGPDGSASQSTEEAAPTELDTSNYGHGLEVGKDKLTVRYVGDGREIYDVGAIHGNRPIPVRRAVYYFEITVLDPGVHSRVTIGFTDKSFNMTRRPGREQNSYGYYGETGRKYRGGDDGEDYGPAFGKNDVVGAGIHLRKQEMFFTKNGTKLRAAFRGVRAPLFPTVALHSKGEKVLVNFGAEPFKFDVEAMVKEERESQQREIQSISISAGLTHRIVRDYLLHYGYADTLAAFDQAAGVEKQAMCNGSEPVDSVVGSLSLRKGLRQHVLSGDVDAALALMRAQCPDAQAGAEGSEGMMFLLHCQKYIELIRQGQISAAVSFAQSALASLPHGDTSWEAFHTAVIALIAYEKPEQSTLKDLLALSQRELVADAVNAVVLEASRGGREAGPQRPSESVLERLLKQLLAVHEALDESNGHQGELFHLRQQLGGVGTQGQGRPARCHR